MAEKHAERMNETLCRVADCDWPRDPGYEMCRWHLREAASTDIFTRKADLEARPKQPKWADVQATRDLWAPEKHLRVPEDMNPPRIEPLGPVPREDKARFQTLQVAGERLACMTVRRRSDNQQVTLVVRWSEGYLEPLAEIISGNAYELYDPEVADLIPDED